MCNVLKCLPASFQVSKREPERKQVKSDSSQNDNSGESLRVPMYC